MRHKTALVFLILVTVVFSVPLTYASVPKVHSLGQSREGDDMKFTIEIEHSDWWLDDHYVDFVEATMDGRTLNFTDLEPQTAFRFSVNGTFYNCEIGDLRVRAHCVTHGWSKWSEFMVREMVEVPLSGSEKPIWYPLVVPLTMMLLIVLMKWRKMIP